MVLLYDSHLWNTSIAENTDIISNNIMLVLSYILTGSIKYRI